MATGNKITRLIIFDIPIPMMDFQLPYLITHLTIRFLNTILMYHRPVSGNNLMDTLPSDAK